MKIRALLGAIAVVATTAAPVMAQNAAEILGEGVLQRLLERSAPRNAAPGTEMPGFVVDPTWPKPLPNNWILGQIAGVYVNPADDHIWVLNRARSLTTEEAGLLPAATSTTNAQGVTTEVSVLNHPRPQGSITDCCAPAPAVLEFDTDGNLLRSWGGPADPGFLEERCREEDGCWWPSNEHGIYVDHNGFVYVGGNGNGTNMDNPALWATDNGRDGMVVKFTQDGEFVLQIGSANADPEDSNDTNGGINGTPKLNRAADMTVDPETNRLYIADGYGNRRVVIVDAETGMYIGHFGAYGQNPVDHEAAEAAGNFAADLDGGNTQPAFFRNPVHCVKIANDGRVYVCDRGNNRIQVFDKNTVGAVCDNPNAEAGVCGFVEEQFISIQTRTTIPGTAVAMNFSNDPDQSCLYVGDNSNMTIYVLNRENLSELGQIGTHGQGIGDFHWLHNVTIDSQGNLYTGEVDTGKRLQRFVRYGASGCSGDGHETVGGVLDQ